MGRLNPDNLKLDPCLRPSSMIFLAGARPSPDSSIVPGRDRVWLDVETL